MSMLRSIRAFVLVVPVCIGGAVAVAAGPDHPIITEVYTDPAPAGSAGDGPIGRDLANSHQEFVEIYLPTALELDPDLNAQALRLTFYEVEGDTGSSGYKLVNYRIDLPTFDLDSSNGITLGAIARPPSGVVVLAWADYASLAPVELVGAPGSCVGLVNDGVTLMTDYVIVAINGRQGSGCTNLEVPDPSNPDPNDAISFINLPGEASSGIYQNGSSAYLLVNRDGGECQGGSRNRLACDPAAPNCPAGICVAGYVKLYDDKDPGHQPPIPNADPSLALGNVLLLSSFLDGVAGNDDLSFDVLLQPMQEDPNIDLTAVLPQGGAYSDLIPQVPEDGGNGYLRLLADVLKTTEDLNASNDDPVADALTAYHTISNAGPWFPTPGHVAKTTSPPELSVATGGTQILDVLSETTAQAGLLAANVGGSFTMNVSTTPGTSSDPTSVTFSSGDVSTVSTAQTAVSAFVAATVSATATDGALVTAPVTVEGVKVNAGDPDVINPIWSTTATVRVFNPTTGLDAAGQPFETTVFVAVQAVPAQQGIANELLNTDLGAFLAAQPDAAALETLGNWSAACTANPPGPCLSDPATDISNPQVVRPMIKDLPNDGEECVTWLPRPGIPLPGFAQTVATSAEVRGGTCQGGIDDGLPCDVSAPNPCSQGHTCGATATTYDTSIGTCSNNGQLVIKAIRVNVPDTLTFGGTFSPSVRIHFADAAGFVGDSASPLTNVNTSRTFEIALIDTAVRNNGTLESGATDDFGMVVEVLDTESWSNFVTGQFVFLSMSGGLQGADIDTLDVPPGNSVATITYLDIDNLHDVLGIRSIEAIYVVDGGATGNVEIIEGFSLNPVPTTGCVSDAECSDPLFCNGAETCVNGVCTPGTPVVCDDGIPCTTDACNEAVDACRFTPDDAFCADPFFCNGLEVCDLIQGCVSPGNPCANPAECREDIDQCGCDPPTVTAIGPRYAAVTPGPGQPAVAIWVQGVDPEVSCVSGYLNAAGRLVDFTTYRPPGAGGWGTVKAHGLDMIAGKQYSFQADCDPTLPGTTRSAPALVTLWKGGDADNSGGVDIGDAVRGVDGFRGRFHLEVDDCVTDADCTQRAPHFQCDQSVGKCLWITIENVDNLGDADCTPNGGISIRDIVETLNFFQGFVDGCRPQCP